MGKKRRHDGREDSGDLQGTTPAGELVRIMAHLRSPRGCPWDREQTHASLSDALIEEAYEAVQAIEHEGPGKLKEELGDLLFQVVFHARLAEEAGQFTFDDVCHTIAEKMKRRHPHVFGQATAADADEVLTQWHEIKALERGGKPGSLMDSVPGKLPALMQAEEVQRRAERVGFDWEKIGDVLDKVEEELGELRETLSGDDSRRVAEEMGDLLFTVVNVARAAGIKPEEALRLTVTKFIKRFTHIEDSLGKRGKQLSEATIDEMNELWEEAKGLAGPE